MHEAKRSNILTKLIGFYKRTNVRSSGPIIMNTNDDEYKAILKQFLKERGWRDKFTEKFIAENVKEIILKMIKDGNDQNAGIYLDEMIEKLESFSTEQMVYIPISGIQTPVTEIKIGNIKFKYMESAETEEFIEKIKHDPIDTDKINKHIKEHVCAEYCATAEPDRALELAEEETRRAIDLLRYAIPFIYGQSWRVAVGMSGDTCTSYRYIPINPNGARSFSSRGIIVGPINKFEFSEENMEILDKIGVFKLSKILQKNNLNPFEKDLLSSVHWFANGQIKVERADKLLNLITCLEILLTPIGNDPISQNVAEGAAILIDESPIERKKTKGRIKKLYKLRSKLTHHGEGDVTDSDIADLIYIDKAVLWVLINKIGEFGTREELHKWIEYKKLGGSPDNWNTYCESAKE